MSDLPRVTIAHIQQATAEHFGLKLNHMLNCRRSRVLARPRQIAMYLACELTLWSLPVIGRKFHRDHSTVHYARHLIPKLAETEPSIAKAIADITRQLSDDPRQINLPLVA